MKSAQRALRVSIGAAVLWAALAKVHQKPGGVTSTSSSGEIGTLWLFKP